MNRNRSSRLIAVGGLGLGLGLLLLMASSSAAADEPAPDSDDDGEDTDEDEHDDDTEAETMTNLTPEAAKSVADLQQRLTAAGVEYFTALELLKIGKPKTGAALGFHGSHFAAPDTVLANLTKIAKKLDAIRREFGKPIRVLSGYRPPTYNDSVGGHSNSKHKTGLAIDGTASDLEGLRAIAKAHFQRGEIRGFGSYLGNIHVDMRTGSPSTWGSKA